MRSLFYVTCILLFSLTMHAQTVKANTIVEIEGGKMVNQRVLVPLRAIFEELDATVQWNQKTKMIIATKDNQVISLTIGSKKVKVNGQTMTIDVPAQIHNETTLVPLRFISESMGTSVKWDASTKMAVINLTDKTILIEVKSNLFPLSENTAIDYLIEKGHVPNGYSIRYAGVEGNAHIIQVFEDMGTHTATLNWFYVNMYNGDITTEFDF